MTEWEKLQTGQLYNDFDRGLFKRRIAAKRLFRAYNRTDDDEQTERRALMEQLFGSVGKNVWIEPDFRCEFGKNITIEDNVYINFGCVILDCAAVTIGADSSLGRTSDSMPSTMPPTLRPASTVPAGAARSILAGASGSAEM